MKKKDKAKKATNSNYLSARESHRISRENRKITKQFEKINKRKNVLEREYLTELKNPNNVVEFENLHTYFFTDVGTVKAVNGVSFEVPQGKTVGIVGESGCGKSVTSLSLMKLVQRPQGQIVEGEIRFDTGKGKVYDISKTPISEMYNIRGNNISMIFQEPMTSLNPVFKIGTQIDEVLTLHSMDVFQDEDETEENVVSNVKITKTKKALIKNRAIDMLELVGIADPETVYERYPHQLSGGMRQRVMIAMAIA